MVEAVAREESDGDVFAGGGGLVVQDADGRGGGAPWCIDVEGCGEGEARQRLQTSAANDGNVDGICSTRKSRQKSGSSSSQNVCLVGLVGGVFGAAFTGICACDVRHLAEAYVYVSY
jgi:hypothetical protein